MKILRKLSLVGLLAVSFYASAQSTNIADPDSWTPGSQDLRILEVRVKQYTFDDVIAAYQFEDIVLLPLGAVSDLIDVAVKVNGETASGFVLKEDRTFFLDTARAEITLKGVTQKYDPAKVHVLLNDIFIDSDLLGDWFDMSFSVDLYAARIALRSDDPLPFLSKLERDQRIARSMSRMNQTETDYPRHYEPYQNWSMPFIDQTLRLEERKTSDGDTVSDYRYTTYATAEIGKLESSLYFSGSEEDSNEDFRISFGRKEPDGGLLGPLNATEFAFGHLTEPRLALINQPSTIEPGVSASSFPLGRQTEYDRNRFIGELLPGWEVELYRNNALIRYQAAPVNGQYDFQDVPLLFGNNHFRLIFYGPQGEIRNQDVRFDLNQSLTRAGENHYRITATDDEDGGDRTVLQFDQGVNKNLSVAANLASIPLEGQTERKQHNYLSTGLRTYGDSMFVTLDAIDDLEGGNATQLSLQTRLDETVFSLTETQLDEFFSEEFSPDEVELSSRSRLRIDTAIPPGFFSRIPVTFEFKRDQFADGGDLVTFTNGISVNTRGMAISNLLTRQEFSGQDPTLNGTLQLSTSQSGIRWRGSMSYELDPKEELTNVALTADPGQLGDYYMTLGLSHSLEQDRTEFDINGNRAPGDYNLSLGARFNSDDEIILSVSLSVSFGQEPRSRKWFTDDRALAGSGSVSARAFIDHNQDGVFNEADEPLPDIGFRLNGGYNSVRTDDTGVGFLTGLSAHQPLNLSIAPESMVDPLWTVAQEGVLVVPRPGRSIELDFPIFVSGEIDGTVYLAKNGKQYGVGRVLVELLDVSGEVIKSTTTAYDGFYVISQVPLGDYDLRISPQQQAELNLIADKTEYLTLGAEDLFLNGFDFVLRENEP